MLLFDRFHLEVNSVSTKMSSASQKRRSSLCKLSVSIHFTLLDEDYFKPGGKAMLKAKKEI